MEYYNWIDYIDGYSGFEWIFEIPVTSEDYKSKVLEFDKIFLGAGQKFGLFSYPSESLVKLYFERRERVFFTKGKQWLSLLDLDQFEDTAKRNLVALLPNKEGQLESVSYHQPFVGLRFLELNNTPNAHWSELKELSFWYETLSFSISSSSNMWWDDISLIENDRGEFSKINTPVNNRFYAYRVTPRFNSFLSELAGKVIELGGTVKLADHDSNNVTEHGILLDGKIIYQEDIDEGRVKLPEF